MSERFKDSLCAAGIMGMVFTALACGTTGDSGPVATPEAKAQGGNVWCEDYNACVLKDYEEVTPSMLNSMALDCSTSGAVSIPLEMRLDANGEITKVTRAAIVCAGS